MVEGIENDVTEITCYASFSILLVIVIMYIWIYRKNIHYFIQHGSFVPQHQGRACPGCGSDDLSMLKNRSARCNACGAIFASTKQLVQKKDK